MMKFRRNFLALLLFIISLPALSFATADTLRVIRSGVQTKTNSPIVTDLTVEGTFTLNSTTLANALSTANLTITKATPVFEVTSSTDTAATIKIDAGTSSDAALKFEDSNTARWSLGNDSSDSDSFVVSASGTLGSTNILKLTTTGASITGTAAVSGTAAITGTATLATANATRLTASGTSSFTGAATFGAAIYQKAITLAADATAIDASLGNVFITAANTGATAIITINNGVAGQMITIIGGSSTNASTLADSGIFNLASAFTCSSGDTITVVSTTGSAWKEVCRSDN